MSRVATLDGAGFRYGQGKLITWNSTTFENVVLWNGAKRTNVTILAGPAALSFTPGQNVAMVGWSPSGGASSWGILGHWVTPGSGAAEAQVDFMRTSLAKATSAEVFADRVHNDNVTTGVPLEGTTSVAFTDLTTLGPTVSGVDITAAGKALVTLSAALVPGVNDGAVMSFEVTGATARSATVDSALILERGPDFVGATVAAVLPVTSLNAGVHQFRAKYRSEFGERAEFDRRGLTVMAF